VIHQNDLAVSISESAVNKNQSQSRAWKVLGDAHLVLGNCKEAIKDYQVATEQEPLDSSYWKSLTNVYQVIGEYNKTIEAWQTAIQNRPTDYLLLVQLGHGYKRMHDYDNAINSYKIVLKNAPQETFLGAYHETEQCLSENGHLIPFIKIDANLLSSFLWFSLGEAHERKGDYDSAFNIYETAIRGYEKALEMKFNALLWRYWGNGTRVDVFGRRRPLPQPILWTALGAAQKAKGHYNGAIISLMKTLETELDNPWIWPMIGDVHTANGDDLEAQKAYERAKSIVI
jgi:tetratricopeptide (TPR) repeat protein